MTKIVYIAGWGRSGTTLLDNLLGQVGGFASAGEIHNIWQRGLREERACGCGQRLSECPVWKAAFEAGFGGIDRVSPSDVIQAMRSVRTRDAGRLLRMLRAGTMLDSCDYASYLKRLYDGLASATGATVIVDSSKSPVDAIVAAALPGYEVFVVHMVRDPRAVAYSWQRRKAVPDKARQGGLLRRVGYVRSTAVWQVFNIVIRRNVQAAVGADHYMHLQYERLAKCPQQVLGEVLDFVGAGGEQLPTFRGNTVDLRPTHTASGNPNRFASGPTPISLDAEWTHSMPVRRKYAITFLSLPTLWTMGYRWRTK